MERITKADLQNALHGHIQALQACGITYDGVLVLTHGSKYNGIAYRINRIPMGETAHWRPPVGGDFLGMTAREAYNNLMARNEVLFDVAYMQRERSEQGS